ncbi:MAG TPA: universal stress protein [Caldilineaceae bacterium]|nr:universal stress protein [Caldilineaceae bacterium]
MVTNRVLIPVDGSAFSLQVLPYVTRFLPPEENELILFYVAPTPNAVFVGGEVFIYADQEAASVEAEFRTMIQPYVLRLREAGYAVTPVIRFGDPVVEIERFIAQEHIDLLAMTTHGRTGLSRVLLGSVAQHLISEVNIPVLLYHPLAKQPVTSELEQRNLEHDALRMPAGR